MARALLIAAVASGQGKTSFTCALAHRLRRQGRRVRAFKVGPDFIDPGHLAAVTGAPVHNLDLWMVGEARCAQWLADAARQADWLLVEGAMGLFDGSPSAADLAARLALPVLAVIDAGAMAETFGALACGLRAYGAPRRLAWAGVAANRVAGEAHARMLRDSLPPGMPWLGHLDDGVPRLPERHLGLVEAHEMQARLPASWQALDAALHLDLAALQRLPAWHRPASLAPPSAPPPLLRGRTVAVARDTAFSFCYAANLDLLCDLGATVTTFSPLADEAVPPGADALYLPGGYPELHAATLARSTRFMTSLRDWHAAGRPLLAECGGMMVCARTLRDLEGRDHAMAGLLDATAEMGTRLAGIGLHAWDTPHGELRGHVFHYGQLHAHATLVPAARTRPQHHGRPEAVYRERGLTASFFHACFASNPEATAALFGA
ncbi:cobyrinate a,c-diamide synthase [Caldimonas thermodepolymerans]|uniref:cobyrinate a,c-diamide synthase n=1 Tax=Caldimonas thermodepolymerans TaxID=215580 RepID=UPI002235951C|nr:cobyrinate a,c-diamide synthase [Caldimonas thermodepolymerans]UZG42808.1 cobyrinate a,c-diamide synthase [Caldimonas thermodepolymerans]